MTQKGVLCGAPMEEIFWRYVTPVGEGCWLWRRIPSGTGYGQFKARGRQWSAHRASWVIHNGPIPSGLNVLHHCDVKLCVRPDHLYLGTQLDNGRDASARGLIRRGEHASGAKLTAALVREIREAPDTNRALAARLGVSYSVIQDVRQRLSWRHVA